MEDSKYDNLELGVLQDFLYWICKNAKASILLAVGIGIIMNSSDTGSDIWICKLLFDRNLIELAMVLIGIDFFPGLMLTAHHVTSVGWTKISQKKKFFTVGLLIIQPFSVIVTNTAWLANVANSHWHLMSRLSMLLHGCVESPLQFVFIVYIWSKGYLRTPWEEYSILKDRNGNTVALGNIAGSFSLVLSTIGIIKGALDVFESHDAKFKFFTFTAINVTYRIVSYAYFIQMFDTWIYVVPLVAMILIPNTIIVLRRATFHGKRIGILTSVICSFIVPICTTEEPQRYQMKITSLDGEEQKVEEENRKKLSNEIRRNSSLLCFITSPMILLADACVVVALNTGTYKHDSIWTDNQLREWLYHFLIPAFFMANLSAISLYRSSVKDD